MGGPRHSVERGHGSLRRDVARAASLCARRYRQASRPTRPAAPTPTITLRPSTPSTRRTHIASIRAADGLAVLGGRGRPPDAKAGRPPGSQAVPARAMDPARHPPPGQGQMSGERRRPRAVRSRPDWRAPPAPRHCRTTGDQLIPAADLVQVEYGHRGPANHLGRLHLWSMRHPGTRPRGVAWAGAVLELRLPGGDHSARGWLSPAPGADAEILGS
jgi:hypothetical protein